MCLQNVSIVPVYPSGTVRPRRLGSGTCAQAHASLMDAEQSVENGLV